MYLVDTSVWIAFLRGRQRPAVERLRALLGTDGQVVMSGPVYQEILQGAESEERLNRFMDYFGSQPFAQPADPLASWAEAARTYFDCRRRGITIRSSFDCLIARIAIEHELTLLHDDEDFVRIATVVPELRQCRE